MEDTTGEQYLTYRYDDQVRNTESHAQYSSVETMSHTCHFPFVVI